MIDERLDDGCGSHGVVCDLLMGNTDTVEVIESLSRLAQGKLQVDVKSQAERHNVRVMLRKL